MNLEQFVDWAKGQSLLYAPSAAREKLGLRGQCVQLVAFYVDMVWHFPTIWADAYQWFANGVYPQYYVRVTNDHNNPNQVPPRGALMIWGPNTPNSGGAGHISICLQANPGQPTFISFDSNWGGKTAHQVTHNWSNVVGWIVPTGGKGGGDAAPAPALAPTPQGGDEMIANPAQARQAYGLLRPNGAASDGEINGTAGHRTWQQFANDAQPEINARDAALRDQAGHLANMQTTINDQNGVITTLTEKLQSTETTAAEKQAALGEAMQKLGDTNAKLSTSHDQIVDLQTRVVGFENNPIIKAQNAVAAAKPNLLQKFLLTVLKHKPGR